MMGDGLAIEPTEGTVVAPADGEIIQFFHTMHAIGLRSKTGLEILIHVGLETVSLEGEGFEGHVKEGDKVKAGDKLITFNLDFIKERAASAVTPIIMTNGDKVESLEKQAHMQAVKGNTEILHVHIKQ
jgi:sugar PTS system EIIA component